MPEDFKAGFLKTLWILRDYLSVIVKGLIFERRKDRQKRAKDLYYIFDILANCPELKEQIIEGLHGFERDYPSWFSRFIRNLQNNFSDLTASGILMISSQRPAGAFPKLTNE